MSSSDTTESQKLKQLNRRRILQLKEAPFLPVLSTPKSKYTITQKMEMTAPFNYFYNILPAFPETYDEPNTIKFSDLLCPSLGEIKCSLQINDVVDFSWLLEQYEEHNIHEKPLAVLYGHEYPELNAYLLTLPPNISTSFICGDKFFMEHYRKIKKSAFEHISKIGIYVYADESLRVVVSTANLRGDDWKLYSQGIWISPLCPRLPKIPPEHNGESPTFFKSNLISYLKSYEYVQSRRILETYINYVVNADFSHIKVFLITSTPKTPTSSIEAILKKYCKIPEKINQDESWDVNVQVSKIGTMPHQAAREFLSEFLQILQGANNQDFDESDKDVKINIIYPTTENVLKSRYGGGCLIYPLKYYKTSGTWICDFMNHWLCKESSRNETMPNLATYCRISPCKNKLAWFLFTSSQLVPRAWAKKCHDSHIKGSFNAGILFIPHFFEHDHFVIESNNENDLKFPFMYDPILRKYSKDDTPWTVSDRYKLKDK